MKFPMETFSVYILYSKSADKYYIGHTKDMTRRLAEHNDPYAASGKVCVKKRSLGTMPFGRRVLLSCGGNKAGEADQILEKQKNDYAIDQFTKTVTHRLSWYPDFTSGLISRSYVRILDGVLKLPRWIAFAGAILFSRI